MSEKIRVVSARIVAVIVCIAMAMPVMCLQQAENAKAWKPEQHVPVGGTVLDDVLPDGEVTIDGIDYPVNPLVYNALSLFPEYYQMGCIGPDAYPDILYGQCFVHPDNVDLVGGSQASYSYQWIDLLLKHAMNVYYGGDYDNSMKALAFTYGYMTHYAGDMFGHTYINELAGGPWDTELRGWDNALRHIVIENYIYKKTNAQLTNWSLMENPFGRGAGPAAFLGDYYFHEFLLNVFYRDPAAKALIPTGGSTTAGWWGDFWSVLTGLEAKMDDYLAEFEKPVDERAWWAVPSPISDIVEKYFTDWKNIIEEGLHAWITTSSLLAFDLFVVKSADAAYTHLMSWVSHYLKNMTMGPLVQAITDFVRGFQNWFNILQVGLTLGFSAIWDYFIDWVKDNTVETLAKAILEKWTGASWEDYKLLIENPGHWFTDEHRDLWTYTSGAPHLAEETRNIIDADLESSYVGDSYVDAMRFPPAYNSVVMSKLVLMDGQGLNTLLHNYGVADKYPDVSPTEMMDINQPMSNIMFGQVKSLDADHQWMAYAPTPFDPLPWEENRVESPSWGSGMPIWTNSDAREKCFKKIFHMGTEVTFDRLKVATLWNTNTSLNLNITNTGCRDDQFIITLSTQGFGTFSGAPTGDVYIRAGETAPYTVYFQCDEIAGRDYAGGKLTVTVTPSSAGYDPYNIFGNSASCIVVAFPFENPTFWLDLDEPVELNFNDSVANPTVQPYVSNPELGPHTRLNPGNLSIEPYPAWMGEPYAYISSRTPMRLYGFSETGGNFTAMSVQYVSSNHLSPVSWPRLIPCPDYKESPWIPLQVTQVNYVDVGHEIGHVKTVSKIPRVYTFVSFLNGIQNPNVYYFNFDQRMETLNATGLIDWTDDTYTIKYTGTTKLGLTYSDSYIVYLDNTPPKTTVHMDKADDVWGRFVVSPDCQVTLTAYDRGSGVEGTNYRIVRNMTVVDDGSGFEVGGHKMAYDSTTIVPWTTYAGSFNLSGLIRSGHSGDVYHLTWYSYDGVSNQEQKNTLKFTLIYDNAPPVTNLTVGTPSMFAVSRLARAFVTHETPITLTATDQYEPLDPDLAGVLKTKYRILNDRYDSGWIEYSGTFTLSDIPDGFYNVDYMSTDKNLNAEVMRRAEIILDATAPYTEASLTGPVKTYADGCYVQPSTEFSLSAVEMGSGLNRTDYRLSGSAQSTGWQRYNGPFSLTGFSSGDYVLGYRSTDNMSNVEQEKTIQVTLITGFAYAGMHNISGHVYKKSTTTPIPGATVLLTPGDYITTADSSGRYSILVPDGSYMVSVTVEGYSEWTGAATVSGSDLGRDIELELLPEQPHIVFGCIRDQTTDEPIVGATVKVGSNSCETDDTGHYSLVVANGTHVIEVSADGYKNRSVTVTMSGVNVTRDIALTVPGSTGAETSSVSEPVAATIVLAVAAAIALVSFLTISKLGVGRRPDEPPPPES